MSWDLKEAQRAFSPWGGDSLEGGSLSNAFIILSLQLMQATFAITRVEPRVEHASEMLADCFNWEERHIKLLGSQ